MASAVTSIYNNVISAASAGFAPTNSADVSAIASSYQVVSATATQLYAGTAYVTSVNDNPLSASRAGNAANASMANSAYYDGTGRLISALPDSATVSAIASSYAESAASSKQDTLTFGYDTSDKINSINGSSLAGEGGGLVTSIQTAQDPWYQQSISGINGSSIYPKWAVSANSAGTADTAGFATFAQSAGAAPTSWASSFISSVSSPSGTIRVMNGNEIEGTNSAVLPSTVVEGFSVVSSIPQSLTAFSFTVPTSNPNTQVVITGGWVNGNFGISGDNGVTAESSVAGQLDVTFDMPGATAFDVTSEAWVNSIGYTASALASEVGGGIGELAWASALPTYQYDAEDKISSINGSAIAGGGGGGLVTAIGTSESGITSINNSGLVDTAALRSADYSSLYVQEPLYISASGDSSYIGFSGTQVNADWTETASSAPSYIENKPDLVDIVAGPGIVIDNPDGNTLRVSTEADAETVLWEGTLNTLNSDVSCSESIYNFDRIKVFYRMVADNTVQSVAVHEFEPSEISSTSFVSFGSFYLISNGWYGWWICRLAVTDNNKIKITKTVNTYGNGASMAGCTVDSNNVGFIYKIVGIHRIANN